MKKVSLIAPYPYYAKGTNNATVYPPLGLLGIGTFLKRKGLDVQIIDANVLKISVEDVVKKIKLFNPDFVGIQLNVITARSGIEISAIIRKDLNPRIILGGPFTPNNFKRLLEDSKADCIVIGEGEITFWELCRSKSLKDVQGISYIKNDNIEFTPQRPLIKNINELPFPDFSLVPELKLYKSRSRKKPFAPVFTSRGCPYKCTFCSSSSKQSPFRNIFRARSPENVIEEIIYLKKSFGIKQIDILDDNFTFDIKRASKILDLIVAKNIDIAINLQSGVRADKLTKDLVHKMKLAGVYKLNIGIESANPDMLHSIKKGLNLNDVSNAVKWCNDEGLITVGLFMIGFLKDTAKTIEQTIDFAIDLNPTQASFSLFLPLPGTELYGEVIKLQGDYSKNDLGDSQVGFLGGSINYEPPNIKRAEILKYQKLAFNRFYFRTGKIFETVRSIGSWHEFLWLVQTSFSIFREIIMKS